MLKYFRAKRGQKGFTLIELMIVVAIIGILAAIAIPQFASYRKKSYDTAAKAELKGWYTACQAYLTDYPAKTISLTNCAVGDTGVFKSSNDVTIATSATGAAQSSHSGGGKIFTVDVNGVMTEAAK